MANTIKLDGATSAQLQSLVRAIQSGQLKRTRNLQIIGSRISSDDSTAILNALGQGGMPDLFMIQMETVVGMDLHALQRAGEKLQQLQGLYFTGTYSAGTYFTGTTVRMASGMLIRIIDAFPKLRHFHLRTNERSPPGLDYSDMLQVMRHVNDNWYGSARNSPLESMTVYHDTLSIVESSERSREASRLAEDRLDDRRRSLRW
jgi:hypothetical protein